jgi:hypothetical protein
MVMIMIGIKSTDSSSSYNYTPYHPIEELSTYASMYQSSHYITSSIPT